MRGKFKFGDPFIELSINGKKIGFLVDTVFSGEIILPSEIITGLGLKLVGFSDYTTANGENVFTEVYLATVDFFNENKKCLVLSTGGNFCIVGLDLLHNCRVLIERCNDIIEIGKIK